MNCNICEHNSAPVFKKTVLKKYNVQYYRCSHCGFMQTDEPVWLEEAYASAITSLDIGLIDRNLYLRNEIPPIIDACFPDAKIMLDYAGGYGMFVRMMRDLGYNFYRQDPYCDNTFTKHFDITDINIKRFDLLTAFEVFEHFVKPLPEIEKMFGYADTIIFSTTLVPNDQSQVEDWWYIAPETGQHLSFYTKKAMEIIAEKFGKKYYGKNNNLHVFTPKTFDKDQIAYAFKNQRYHSLLGGLIKTKLPFGAQRDSLLQKDVEHIKGIINS